MMYNQFGTMKTPQQMQNELGQLMRQYQSMYESMAQPPVMEPQCARQNGGNANLALRRRGEFVEVLDPKEVEEAAVRMDGTPTLFVNFKAGIFWAKKYQDGAARVTPYTFAPMAGSGGFQSEPQESIPDYTKELVDDGPEPDLMDARIAKLETMMGQLYERMMGDGPNGFSESSEQRKQSETSPRPGAKRAGKEIPRNCSDAVYDDQARG